MWNRDKQKVLNMSVPRREELVTSFCSELEEGSHLHILSMLDPF